VYKGKANCRKPVPLTVILYPAHPLYETDCGYICLCGVPLSTAPPPPPQSYLVSDVLSAAAGGYVAAMRDEGWEWE